MFAEVRNYCTRCCNNFIQDISYGTVSGLIGGALGGLQATLLPKIGVPALGTIAITTIELGVVNLAILAFGNIRTSFQAAPTFGVLIGAGYAIANQENEEAIPIAAGMGAALGLITGLALATFNAPPRQAGQAPQELNVMGNPPPPLQGEPDPQGLAVVDDAPPMAHEEVLNVVIEQPGEQPLAEADFGGQQEGLPEVNGHVEGEQPGEVVAEDFEGQQEGLPGEGQQEGLPQVNGHAAEEQPGAA